MPPPRDPNSPPGKNRRRPEVMPGGWLWLVLLVLLVLVMMFYINFGRQEDTTAWIAPMLTFLLPALVLLAIFFFFLLPRFRDPLGGGFLSNYIKSPAKRYEKNKMRVTFDDVADMSSAKFELQEIVDFLKEPQKFQ